MHFPVHCRPLPGKRLLIQWLIHWCFARVSSKPCQYVTSNNVFCYNKRLVLIIAAGDFYERHWPKSTKSGRCDVSITSLKNNSSAVSYVFINPLLGKTLSPIPINSILKYLENNPLFGMLTKGGMWEEPNIRYSSVASSLHRRRKCSTSNSECVRFKLMSSQSSAWGRITSELHKMHESE